MVTRKLSLGERSRNWIYLVTKLSSWPRYVSLVSVLQLSHHLHLRQVYNVVGREYSTHQISGRKDPDQNGYVNQHGLSRKACFQSNVSRCFDFLNLRNSTSSQAWKRVWSGFNWITLTFYNACLAINMLIANSYGLFTCRSQIRQRNADWRDGDAYFLLAFLR